MVDITQAARNTIKIWHKRLQEDAKGRIAEVPLPTPRCNEEGKNLPHQHYLLLEVAEGRITGEKAHRWVGYAQGYLVNDGILSLNDVKYAVLFS
jgi:hypothetical protein